MKTKMTGRYLREVHLRGCNLLYAHPLAITDFNSVIDVEQFICSRG